MKIINNLTLAIALASAGLMVTGCIDEVEPTSSVSQNQLDSSVSAGAAAIYAMPGYMPNFDTSGYYPGSTSHIDFGYSSFMHVRDCMTGDMCKPAIGLNRYALWSECYVTDNLAYTQLIWNYYYKQILSTNIAARSYDPESDNETARACHAVALAYRAMLYLDIARWYEFLPNDMTSSITNEGNDVMNLTVPIVTETTTEEEARNNPRAKREDMFEFIKKDLEYAEQNISASPYAGDKTLPDLACVYGLMARLYLWVENYQKAAEYADKAIASSSCSPMNEAEWTDPVNGFNSLSNRAWMWGMTFSKENDAVQTGICNWTSMLSSEAAYGYAGAGATCSIDRSMYDRLSDTDFRKLSWSAPANSTLADKVSYCYPSSTARRPYVGVKFRPGEGNPGDYTVGSSVAVPLMRIEEMYFIKFEAEAHNSATITDFVQWMKANRDPQYSTTAASKEELVEEIVFQKRIEFWGEGLALFDIKRLNYSVTRAYAGTNWPADYRYNTNGRPAWMNMIIIRSEGNNNKAIQGWNNPNVADIYTPITGI